METFKDLVFVPRYTEQELKKFRRVSPLIYDAFKDSKRAISSFDNGYGVSVLCGKAYYSNGVDTYEVTVLRDGKSCYKTSVASDVLPFQTSDQVTRVMMEVQKLPLNKKEILK